MEDLSTTAAAYSKEELASMVRHPIVAEVSRILSHHAEIEELVNDKNKSHNDIQEETRSCVDAMTVIWSLLGPARAIARRLYPQQIHIFDMLDKSLFLLESFEDLSLGKAIRVEKPCEKLCCTKLL